MTRLPGRLLFALLLVAGMPAWAAPPPSDVAEILRNARAWDARQRPDMARGLLQKLLLVQPDSAAGLLLLGDVEARAGNAAAAQDALRRLEAVGAQLPETRQLRTIVALTTQGKGQLAKIRLLARAGKAEEAMAELRVLMPDGPPPGELAVEYYQILGATPQGMPAAQAALKQLAQTTGEWRYGLAQAVLLGGPQTTRQDAARAFQQLSRRSDVDHRQLAAAWKHVLDRLRDGVETIPFLEPYVAYEPADKMSAERLAMLRAMPAQARAAAVVPGAAGAPGASAAVAPVVIDPTTREVDAGLDALSRGELPEAERILTGVLKKRPRDPDVLGGIGRVLIRQGKEDEAQKWLAQAARNDPANRERWVAMGSNAMVAGRLRKAGEFDAAGKPAAAEQELRAVLAAQPDNVDAIVLLGSVRYRQGDLGEAETLLRDGLRREPDNGTASRALVRLLLQQNRRDDVMAVIAQDKDGSFAYVKSGYLKDDADKLADAGKRIEATEVLQQALALDPTDPWIRFSLARLYALMKLTSNANRVMAEGMKLAPGDPSMAYATALYVQGQDRPEEALRLLATIPVASRTQGMSELGKRASIAAARRQAAALYAKGERRQGDEVLIQAEKLADDSSDDARAMAEMWFGADQQDRGLAWMKQAADKPDAVPEVKLYYAGLLNRAKRDDALATLVSQLENQPGWTEAQGQSLFNIKMDMAERRVTALAAQGQADAARALALASTPADSAAPEAAKAKARLLSEAGDPAAAVAVLKEVVAQQADDVGSRIELARNLALTRQKEAARAEVRQGLSRAAPADIENRLSAARLLVRMDQFVAARDVMDGLRQVAPDDPAVLVQAGRVERADRKYSLAMRYFQLAREKELLAAAPTAQTPIGETGFAPVTEVLPLSADQVEPAPVAPAPGSVSSVAEVALVETAAVVATAPAPASTMPTAAAPITAASITTLAIVAVPSTPESGARPASASFLAGLPHPAPVQVAPSTAQNEIESIEARRMPRIESGLSLLRKDSSPGLSSMRGTEVPVIAYVPVGYDGHAFAQVDAVSLDAGALPAAFDDAALFGKVQAYGSSLPGDISQKARGTSAALGYENDDVRVDLGVVGMGFPVTNVVGGVRKTGEFAVSDDRSFRYAAEASRRPVTSTLLSYAGARDPVTGEVWGGVVQTGGSLRASTDLGPYSASTTLGYSWYTGKNVLTNKRFAVRSAIDRDIVNRPGLVVNTGLTLTHWRFSENENNLTFGNGGYYSPQRYTALGVPLSFSGRIDRFTYLARGSVSFSRSRERAANFYPTDAALQAQAAGALLPAGYTSPVYDASSGKGVGYSLRLAAEYQLTPQLSVGSLFNIDRSSYYNPLNMQIYLRYFFNETRRTLDQTPTGVNAYSQY